MVDLALLTAALGAAGAGIGLIDKIADQVTRLLTKRDAGAMPVEHRVIIKQEGADLVSRHQGREKQRITAADLAKLPEPMLRHVMAHEKSMENHHKVWASVYPQLALETNAVTKARTELQLQEIVRAMKGDLVAILRFLEAAGLQLDDHYIHIRDAVTEA